jgi:small nuclear ribonucleoprotein (snRNP)-like protein
VQGILEDFDDLVKMVLKERTKKRKKQKKQTAVMA